MTDAHTNDDQFPDTQPADPNVIMSLAQAIAIAHSLHRQGHLGEAANIYRQILSAKPDQPEALHFLGVLMHQLGQSDAGEKLILAALETNPGYIDAISNLGNIYVESERYREAAEVYQRAISIKPDFIDAHLNLATLFYRCGLFEEANAEWLSVMSLSPELSEAHDAVGSDERTQNETNASSSSLESNPMAIRLYRSMANSFMRLGRVDEAVDFFRRWQEVDPGNPRPRHHIAALTGVDVPSRAPEDYVKSIFDLFAESFDDQLEKLEYSAPARVIEAVIGEIGDTTASLSVLDAGCGTGLCAAGIRSFARRLVGVDLSGKMLEKARERGNYDELIESELTEYLLRCPESFDLIISADTLIYFGEQLDVMTAAASVLRPGGRFVFTLESATEEQTPNGSRLQGNGRYQHSQSYVTRTLQQAGLKLVSLSEIFLRNEGRKKVLGWLVVAQRTDSTA